MKVFFYYNLSKPEDSQTLQLLLRVEKRFASRANYAEEELAELMMELKRDALLQNVMEKTGYTSYRLIGCCELSPEGDELYEENGGFELTFWYAETSYGKPWIVLSQAETAEDFYRILNEDEDMMRMNPIFPCPSQKIAALFYTDKDFSLDEEALEQKAVHVLEALHGSVNKTNEPSPCLSV